MINLVITYETICSPASLMPGYFRNRPVVESDTDPKRKRGRFNCILVTFLKLCSLGFSAPKGRLYVSPGQRPGLAIFRESQALKGRHYSADRLRAAPSGLQNL